MFDRIQETFFEFITKLGPLCVALMPALFIGSSIFLSLSPVFNFWFALFVAVVVAFGLETVGIVTAHTVIEMFNGMTQRKTHAVKFWTAVLMVPLYIGGIFFVVWVSHEHFTDAVWGLGLASPFFTMTVYLATGLAIDAKSDKAEADRVKEEGRQERREERQKQRDHKRKMELMELSGTSTELPRGQTTSTELPKPSAEDMEFARNIQGMSTEGPFGPADIMEHLGIEKSSAYKSLKSAKDAGLIRKVRKGKYQMTGVLNGKG